MMNTCLKEHNDFGESKTQHVYFCTPDSSGGCMCIFIDPIMVSLLNDGHERSLKLSEESVPDIEELPLNMSAIRQREHKYYYKLKCLAPQCKTTYKFACKCNAAQLLLYGCPNCETTMYESLERWNKKINKMVGKTELRQEAICRIVDDVFGQNHRTTCNLNYNTDSINLSKFDIIINHKLGVKSSSKLCGCPCSCLCGCSWTDKYTGSRCEFKSKNSLQ